MSGQRVKRRGSHMNVPLRHMPVDGCIKLRLSWKVGGIIPYAHKQAFVAAIHEGWNPRFGTLNNGMAFTASFRAQPRERLRDQMHRTRADAQ